MLSVVVVFHCSTEFLRSLQEKSSVILFAYGFMQSTTTSIFFVFLTFSRLLAGVIRAVQPIRCQFVIKKIYLIYLQTLYYTVTVRSV